MSKQMQQEGKIKKFIRKNMRLAKKMLEDPKGIRLEVANQGLRKNLYAIGGIRTLKSNKIEPDFLQRLKPIAQKMGIQPQVA